MDTSQGEAAVNKFGQSFNKMARETEQEAKRAKDAIKEIPTAFQAEKIDRDTRTIAASIKRTTTQMELLGKTASQKFELKIESKGLDKAQFEPALQKMREIEAQAVRVGAAGVVSFDKFGMSAKQTAFALRGVPAQFTDIVTSLQGGQKPLTVFLQQGGQLKDMFGGAGNAARALGGYVAGLINPFTIAAAGIGVFGLAMAKANSAMSESNGIAVRLEATGRSADITREQFSSLTKELALLPGVSKDASKAILGEFLKTREIGGGLFRELGMSVADFAAATGVTAPEAAKTLAKAFADPVKGAKELEAALGSLTSGQLLTIEALEKVGDKAGAQRILMDALKASVNGMANEALTPLGRAVDDLGNAWGGMLGKVGNSSALNTANNIFAAMIGNVAALARNLSSMKLPPWLEKQFSGGLNGLVFDALGGKGEQKGVTGSWAAPVDKVDEQVKNVLNLTTSYRSQAGAMADVKAQGDLLRKSLEALRGEGKGNSVQAKELEDRLTGVSEKLASMGKKAGGGSAATAAKRELSEYDKLIAAIKTKILQNEAEVAGNGKLNESEKLRLSLVTQIEQGTRKMTAAHLESAQAQLKQLDASEQAKAVYLAQQKFEVERGKEIVSRNNGILKIEESAQALEDEVAMYGKGKEAIEALSIARLEEKKAILLQFDGSDQRIQQIEDEIAARKRLAVAGDGMAALKMGTHTDQLLANAKEQASLYEDELKLTGLTSLERAKVVAQRQVEIKYAKELAKVDASQLSDADKAIQRQKINEARQIEGSAAVNKVIQDDWAKTADQINQSLTDALMRGFESGKGFGQNLRDTLVNMFKTMVLRPTIEAVLSPVSGAINGVVNGVVGGGSGGMLGMASGASSLYSNGAALGGLFASNAAYGAAIGTTSIGVGSQAAMLAAQTGTFGAAGVAATSSSAAVAGGAGSGVMGALGAMGPAGWAALAALAVVAVVASQKGDSRFGSQASYTPKDGAKSYGGPNGTADDFGGVSAANKASAMSIDMLLKKVGSLDTLARFGSGFESSEKGKGFSYAGGTLSNGKAFGQGNDGMGYMNNRGSMNAEEAQASYIKELKQATLQALQSATDIPKSISEKLAGVNIDSLSDAALTELSTTIDRIIGEVDTFKTSMESLPFSNLKDLSFEAAAGLIAASGGFETLSANLATYYENFYSAEERRVQTVKNITAALNAAGGDVTAEQVANASRAQFRAYAEGVDTTTAAGQKLYAALLGVSGAFAGITDAAVDASAALLSGVSTARQALDKALADQNNVLTTSYRSQSSELQSTITKFRGFADQLKKFRDGLLLGGMSPLTPEQRYAEAQRQFESAKSGGDAGELQTASSALLEASKVYNASNATYISDFSKVQEALSAAAINASATADVAQLQLSAVQSQLSVLERVNSSVLSVADAMAGLTAAVIAAVSGGANPGLANIARITGGAVDREVGNAYMSSGGAGAVRGTKGWQVFTPGGDSFSQDYAKQFVKDQLAANNPREIYDAAKRSGLSLRALDDLINWAPGTAEQWAIENGLPTFANGGNHAGGWAMVGERGPELAYMPPARIYNAGDTSRMTDGRGNAELVAEIRALREEVKQLRTEQNQQTGALIQSNYDASAQNADAITTRQSKQGWSKKEPELA